MALNACTSCTTKFAVGLPKCPHCGSTDYVEDGDVMAKITRSGGASDDTLPAPEPVDVPADSPAPQDAQAAVPEPEQESEAGGEDEAHKEPSPEAEAVEPDPASSSDYEAETVEQLRERLTARGLPKSGKRDDLVLRLLEDDDAPTAGTE